MIYPELRNILCPDLEPPNLPEDPVECAVNFQVLIGPQEGDEMEAYTFTVVTPAYLARSPEPQWGRGLLIIAVFEWQAVVRAIAELLAASARSHWPDVVAELNRNLRRESIKNGTSDL